MIYIRDKIYGTLIRIFFCFVVFGSLTISENLKKKKISMSREMQIRKPKKDNGKTENLNEKVEKNHQCRGKCGSQNSDAYVDDNDDNRNKQNKLIRFIHSQSKVDSNDA
ncbi:hypothetical protein DERP_007363 [Dermatophagoides pteronyssinus]|uniref:Fam-c protein n=1 Tax=Dermatophagoides pteronyssinus TaxID=6956 RepID=A0ABQ8J496_DERPT|nr:hypothetical protein DERP_007363 [Dermatophagoides pteronyssinus]